MSQAFGENVPLYLTFDRLLIIQESFHSICQFVNDVYCRCCELSQIWENISGKSNYFPADNVDFGHTEDALLAEQRATIFPELRLEIFDEVTEEDLSSSWNYDYSKIYAVLASAKLIIEKIIQLEEDIKIVSEIEHDIILYLFLFYFNTIQLLFRKHRRTRKLLPERPDELQLDLTTMMKRKKKRRRKKKTKQYLYIHSPHRCCSFRVSRRRYCTSWWLLLIRIIVMMLKKLLSRL
jgi:hypothetical protein